MKPLAIIGLDPGTTSAYGILSLDGKLIKAHSAKELSLSAIIKETMEVCQPLIVATDKAKVPWLIEEYSRKVGAEIIAPEEDLKKEIKRDLLYEHKFQDILRDAHEQDCVAAALYGYKKRIGRITKINHFIHLHQLEDKKDEFTLLAWREELPFMLLKGMITNSTPETEIMKQVMVDKKITQKDFLRLYQKLHQVEEEKQELQMKLGDTNCQLKKLQKTNQVLDTKLRHVDQRVDALFKFKEERVAWQSHKIREQQNTIRSLEKKMKEIYSFIEKTSGGQMVKKMNTLSKSEFIQRRPILHIQENDLLLVKHPHIFSEEVLRELSTKGVTILSFEKAGKGVQAYLSTLIIPAEEIKTENEYFALIDVQFMEKNKRADEIMEKVMREYREDKRRT